MLLTTAHYGLPPIPVTLRSEWAAFLLPGTVPALAVGGIAIVQWRQIAEASVSTGEVGLAYGTPTPGADPMLTFCGVTDAEALLEAPAGDANVACAVTLAYPVPAGASLWAVFNVACTGAGPTLMGANAVDPCAIGVVLTRDVTGWIADQYGDPMLFNVQRDRRPVQLAVTVG
jgi:hypothetical protein